MLVDQLENIKTETFKVQKATQCAYCKKNNLINPYVYKEEHDYKTVFCDSDCLNK